MDIIYWAVGIGFIAGSVNGSIRTGSWFVDLFIGIVLIFIAQALAVAFLVK